MRKLRLLIGALSAALLLAGLATAPAEARKVNVGPSGAQVRASIPGGLLRVRSNSFDLAQIDPDPTLTGTVAANGTLNFPMSGIVFPPFTYTMSNGDRITIRVIPTHDWTGVLNANTGHTTLRARFRLKLEGSPQGFDLGGNCYIGTTANPIDLNPAHTGTESAIGSNPSITGRPYNPGNGTGRLVNNRAAVPEANGCGTGLFASFINDEINNQLGLPSPSGNNEAQIELLFSNTAPYTRPQPGMVASFTATPSSGGDPLSVTFDASGSTVPASTTQYLWDFDNNGTVDQTTTGPTVQHTYTGIGTKTARLRVRDTADGEFDETTRTVTVTPPPNLSLTKGHSGNFRVGDTGTYTLTVTNAAGAGPTEGTTTITDTLPQGFTFVSGSGGGFSCASMNGTTVTCTRTTAIAAGQSASVNLTVAVGPTAPGSVTNTATVSTPKDSNTGDNTATDPTTVERTDLAIDKSHAGDFHVRGQGRYSLAVSNVGTAASSGTTTVRDTLPDGLTYQAFEGTGWSCSTQGQDVTCRYNDPIPAGATRTVDLLVGVGQAAAPSVTNTATVSTAAGQLDEPNQANNSDSDPTNVQEDPDLAIDKSHSGDFRVGDRESYTLSVSNVGVKDATGTTTVTDTVPSGLTPVSASGTGWSCQVTGQEVTCTNDTTVAPGTSLPDITLAVDVAASARPSVTNTASVSTNGAEDPFPGNDTDSDPTDVGATDLTIEKSDGGGFRAGRDQTYTLQVKNVGDAASSGTTTVTDTLPGEVTYRSATGQGWSCSASGRTVTCTTPNTIAAGASAPPISLVVGVPATAPDTIENTATVQGDDDIDPSNDSHTITTNVSAIDLSIGKRHNGDFRAGETRAYTIAVDNNGGTATTGATTVSDTLPAGLTYAGFEGVGWSCSASGQGVTCTYGDPIAGDSAAPHLVIRVDVGAAAAPQVTNRATVSTANDRIQGNNTDDDPTTVVAPDVTVDKSHTGSFRAGGTAVFTLVARNVGTAPTSGPTTVVDDLPSGLSYREATGDGWECDEDSGQVTCTYTEAIPVGTSAPAITLETDVAVSAPAAMTNNATASTPFDQDSSNNDDGDDFSVQHVDLAMSKSSTGDLEAGRNATYSLQVENRGTAATVGGTRVTDNLPTGLRYVSAGGSGWSCAAQGAQVECNRSASLAAGTTAPTITLEAAVESAASGSIENNASVSTRDDANGSNNSDGDTRNVVAGPDLSLDLRLRGDSMRVGDRGTYTLAVRNVGERDTSGGTTATVSLPQGLSFVSGTGDGWSCSAATGGASCTRSDPVPANERRDIVLEVAVDRTADEAVTTTASVASTPDASSANNSDSEESSVTRIDLGITKSGPSSMQAGSNSGYTLQVRNFGTAATVGPTVVRDRVPSGLSPVSAGGTGWQCSIFGRDVRCERRQEGEPRIDPIRPGVTAEPISIQVAVARSASGTIRNTASVTTQDDVQPANDSSTAASSVRAASGRAAPSRTAPPPARPAPRRSAAPRSAPRPRPELRVVGLRASGRTALVRLRCSGAPCAGSLAMGPARARSARAARSFGVRSFRLAAGRTAVVRVRLSHSARRKLRRARSRRVTLSVKLRGRSGRIVVVRTLRRR